VDIHIAQGDGRCILDVIGEIDLYNAYRLKDAVKSILDTRACPFVLNLNKVTYVDSSGIGALLSINATLSQKRIPFRIVNVPPFVMRLMELTRLVGFLPVEVPGSEAPGMMVGSKKAPGLKARASRARNEV
jgi:anti-sigma B factor antagonist